MKKRFSLLVLPFILSLTSPCQSIVKSTNLWNNAITLEPAGNLVTETIRFTADTTINFVSYKLVERALDSNQIVWSRYGFIREDASKQVFYKLNAAAPEKLIYSMNLDLNDSILAFGVNTMHTTGPYLDSAMYYVTRVDSFPVGGTYQRQLHLSVNVEGSLVESEHWVDSLGSLSGMLHNFNMKVGEDGYSLLCFKEDGLLLYQNPYFTDCYVVTGITPNRNRDVTVSVYPNPVSGTSAFRINGLNDIPAIEVRFYNALGEPVFVKRGLNEFQLRKSELESGVYNYRIESSGRPVLSGKIVVN
ncbi:MAG: T9SS type A sorting domain-containing protein [Bacteroidetes bacterium]|nr:T9SS type A sorting domain-containing protein [Bacteroidota bacterium]